MSGEQGQRRGWFKIDGQDGDRYPEEQFAAIQEVIDSCAGKSVLDLGSAEGVVAGEFARAGAKHVLCIESIPGHVAVGTKLCEGLPVEFECADIAQIADQRIIHADIVLCLGVAHKLRDPAICLRFAARSCNPGGLILLRCGHRIDANGIITSKHGGAPCNSRVLLEGLGFQLIKTVKGPPPHSEEVYYWHRYR